MGIKLALLSCGGFVCGLVLVEIGLRLVSPNGLVLSMPSSLPEDIEVRAHRAEERDGAAVATADRRNEPREIVDQRRYTTVFDDAASAMQLE